MTSKTLTFTTKNKNQIDLAIVTAKPDLTDHTQMSACYDLDLCINDDLQCGGAINVVNDNDHGKCIKQAFSNKLIPIPDQKIEAVESLIYEYNAEVERRVNASVKAENDYNAHQTAIYKMMDANEDR